MGTKSLQECENKGDNRKKWMDKELESGGVAEGRFDFQDSRAMIAPVA